MDQLSVRNSRAIHSELARYGPSKLGSAEFIPATRQLMGPSGALVLEPRVAQVLTELIAAGGAPVSRDELLDKCWGGVIVEESALNRVISRIRKAAEAVGPDSFRIETLSKLGYRLIVYSPDAASVGVGVGRRWVLGSAVALTAASAAALWPQPTAEDQLRPEDAQARDLQARALNEMRHHLPDRDAQAIALLREAVTLSPNDGSLWGTLALAYQREAELGPPKAAEVASRNTEAAARRALQLDRNNRDARVALALDAPVFGRWSQAESQYRQLGGAAPGHAALLAGHAKLLSEVGRFSAAMVMMDRVFAIEPLSPAYHWRRALGLWGAGRSEESDRLMERALRVWPRHISIYNVAFWLRLHTGRPAEALHLLDDPTARPTGMTEPQVQFMRRSASASTMGDATAIERTVALNLASAKLGTSIAEQAMAVAAGLGAVDAAFQIADAYYFDEGFSVADDRVESGAMMPMRRRKTLPLFWPPMKAMRDDRRFAQLVERLGLTAYWTQSGRLPDYQQSQVGRLVFR